MDFDATSWDDRAMRSCSYLILTTLMLCTTPARATQWTVDASAAPGGNGSPQSPFNTLAQAVAALATGDTVLVNSGTYNEQVNLWQVKQGSGGPTVIKAAPGATPVIDGGGSADFVVQAGETDDVTFQGLTVQNSQGSGFLFHKAHDGKVIDCTTTNVTTGVTFYFADRGLVRGSDLEGGVAGKATDGTEVRESKIHGSAGNGLYLHAASKNCKYVANEIFDNTPNQIYIDSSSKMTVDRNLIYMSQAPPQDHAAILLADEQYPNVTAPLLAEVTITNNVMLGNGLGVAFWSGDFPGQSGMKSVRIANNTMVNCAEAALSWDAGAHSAEVRNNIFADDGKGSASMLLMAKSSTGVTLDHNLWHMPWVNDYLFWGGSAMTHYAWVQASGQGAGDILADPQLVGPLTATAANFALKPGSPAIDKGAALAYVTHDYAGNPRPVGAAHDVGAFESGGATGDGGVDGGPGDAGITGPDGLLPVTDQGAAAGDAGSGGGGSDDEGCACGVGHRSARWPGLLLLALALLLRGRRPSGR